MTIEVARQRKIIHIDMDAFYASVEQRDDLSLRGKPVVVGYAQARGVVAAASYEARKLGVYSAMASVTAKRKCPELIFVPSRFDVYKSVSRQIHEIFAQHTQMIEPLSLDEAYLDVTENLQAIPFASHIAEVIRVKIFEETGLTASAGISYNKFLAVLASAISATASSPRRNKPFTKAIRQVSKYSIGSPTSRANRSPAMICRADSNARSSPSGKPICLSEAD